MPQAWVILLKGLAAKAIWGGLETLKTRDSTFAPNGIEFANACKPAVGSIAHKEFKPVKQIVDQGAKERANEARIKAMKNML